MADFASIILGKIGASEHSELRWEKYIGTLSGSDEKNRYKRDLAITL